MIDILVVYFLIGLILCIVDVILYGEGYSFPPLSWVIGVTLWPYIVYRAYKKVRSKNHDI